MAGSDTPVQISLTMHPADWDADDYVRSKATRVASTVPTAELTPAAADSSATIGSQQLAAAAGSSRGPVESSSQPLSDAGTTTFGPFTVIARKCADLQNRLTALKLPDGYKQGAYDVVLQEQVRGGGSGICALFQQYSSNC